MAREAQLKREQGPEDKSDDGEDADDRAGGDGDDAPAPETVKDICNVRCVEGAFGVLQGVRRWRDLNFFRARSPRKIGNTLLSAIEARVVFASSNLDNASTLTLGAVLVSSFPPWVLAAKARYSEST